MKKIEALCCFLLLALRAAEAQTDTSAMQLTVSAYVEPYFGYDVNKPADGNRPGFVYAYNRHNELNVNLAFLKANLQASNVRANVALMAGTYPNANLGAEPGTLKNLFEANAGVKLFKKYDIWLDGGILPSHIGFESAVGKDCWTLTRSMMAENSPYYETGAKVSYTTNNGKWLLSLLALNGWQRIQRAPDSNFLSAGTQVQYKPNDRVTLNHSTYSGTEYPDSFGVVRAFSDLYGIFQLGERWGLTLGFDAGLQETNRQDEFSAWYSAVLIARYTGNNGMAVAGRVEYFNDRDGVIIATGTPNGFQTLGVSLNFDAPVHKNALLRFEAKLFSSEDEIFVKDRQPARTNAVLTWALAVWL